MTQPKFHDELKILLDTFAHLVYKQTKTFPKEEIYGITSQLRRASLSVVLNYVEGYARRRNKVYKNFLEISYGSLQESKYLIDFCFKENILSDSDYKESMMLADKIGAMLWGVLSKMDS